MRILCLVLVLLAFGGCGTVRDARIRVVDGASGAVVPGAEVRVSRLGKFLSLEHFLGLDGGRDFPQDQRGTTSADGEFPVKLFDGDHDVFWVNASHPGIGEGKLVLNPWRFDRDGPIVLIALKPVQEPSE